MIFIFSWYVSPETARTLCLRASAALTPFLGSNSKFDSTPLSVSLLDSNLCQIGLLILVETQIQIFTQSLEG